MDSVQLHSTGYGPVIYVNKYDTQPPTHVWQRLLIMTANTTESALVLVLGPTVMIAWIWPNNTGTHIVEKYKLFPLVLQKQSLTSFNALIA